MNSRLRRTRRIYPLAVLLTIFISQPATLAHSGWQDEPYDPRSDPFAALKTYHRRQRPFDPSRLNHSHRVPALPPELAPGETFDYKSLQSSLAVYRWYPVPDWLAGTWESQHRTRTYFYHQQSKVKKTSPERQDVPLVLTLGCQKDQLGGVWHYLGVPSRTLQPAEAEDIVLWDQKSEPVLVGPDSVITRNLSTLVRIKKKSGKIKSAESKETIAQLDLTGDGRLKVVASIKTFGTYGQPLNEIKTFRLMKKKCGFKALDRYKNQDLADLFRTFLKERNLEHLIPGDNSSSK